MKKKYFSALSMCLYLFSSFMAMSLPASLPILSDTKIKNTNKLDGENTPFPRNYRTSFGQLPTNTSQHLNTQGLNLLNISGSGQFSDKQLKNVIQDILKKQKNLSPKQFFIVDLRQEHHLFLNGQPITFFSPSFSHNWGKTNRQVQEEEQSYKANIALLPFAPVHYHIKKDKHGATIGQTQKFNIAVQQVKTEEDIANELGVKYVRFAVSDHHAPLPEVVDAFIKFVQSLPKASWVHLHCRGGRGRTSTFWLMLDMIRNAKYVSKEEILERNILLGGKDLHAKTTIQKKKDVLSQAYATGVKASYAKREEFVDLFYEYAKAKDGFGYQSWSTWSQQHQASQQNLIPVVQKTPVMGNQQTTNPVPLAAIGG